MSASCKKCGATENDVFDGYSYFQCLKCGHVVGDLPKSIVAPSTTIALTPAPDSEAARLRGVIERLLLSADCEWENRREGHDWTEACQEARAHLAREPAAQVVHAINCEISEMLGPNCTCGAQPAAQSACNPHPDAPHGFDRQASHSENRYVCECEGWEQPAAREPEGRWVLQDSRSYVGNDVLFWATGGGYTTDLRNAEIFSEDAARRQQRVRDTDIPWPKAYIDGKTRPAVDFQCLDKSQAMVRASEPAEGEG